MTYGNQSSSSFSFFTFIFFLASGAPTQRAREEEEKMMMVTDMANQNPRIRNESVLLPPKRLRTGPAREESSISSKEKKDKIGERVSALQHLVSPFGKSDTASVLKEAAAYIKFLQDQLQVLSTPYLRTFPHGKLQEGEKSHSLRNRGLCLMPVDETVLIARSNGADIWAPISK